MRDSVKRFTDYASVGFAVETVSRLTKSKLAIESIKTKNSYGRVVPENITSPINVPDRQRSHMDGYAVTSSSLIGASSRSPKILSFIGDVDLAHVRRQRISRGHTIGIVTGGELPLGADAVVPLEHTERSGDRVYFYKEVKTREFCFPVGVDVQKGAVVIPSGATIRAQDIGMLALLGIREIRAYSKPRVAIIATGDELVDPFVKRDPRRVPESHSPIFQNLIRELGGVTSLREIVPDDLYLISETIKRALRTSDIVLTLGGTSLGEADLVEQTLRKISKKSRIIHGIRMDRGRVAGVAAVQGKPVVMLPGPVQGAMNAFLLLALPLILRMTKGRELSASVKAPLSTSWKARKKFPDFTKVLYVRLERNGESLEAHPFVGDTESISVLTNSNGFVIVPENVRELRAGEEVSVRLLPGFSYAGAQFLAG
ncbi:MAG TPA: molybdopterin molybdotransferase MoeA [Candidatus Angelobacter sp.]|nr:molybdopterin molybdotransferase MoeA [Candidatus Angelobacter sp.]